MADENEPPPVSKLTRTKQRWAREGRFLTGKVSRPEQQRLPPGQHLTRDWPVLDLGLTPQISRERWRLDVYGAVENPVFWDFAQFTAQPQTKFTSDIHCVTTWSRYDNQWEGLATRDLLDACRPRDETKYVVLHSHDGYTTNLALEDFAAEDCPARARLVRRAAGAGAWRPGAAGGAASLFLEEREVAAEHRIPRRGYAGLLGGPRLSQPRRSLGRAALFRRLTRWPIPTMETERAD
jgi:Oxidoreductase molybdopterin binding domain